MFGNRTGIGIAEWNDASIRSTSRKTCSPRSGLSDKGVKDFTFSSEKAFKQKGNFHKIIEGIFSGFEFHQHIDIV